MHQMADCGGVDCRELTYQWTRNTTSINTGLFGHFRQYPLKYTVMKPPSVNQVFFEYNKMDKISSMEQKENQL